MKKISLIGVILVFGMTFVFFSITAAQDIGDSDAADYPTAEQPPDSPDQIELREPQTARPQLVEGGSCLIDAWQTVASVNTGRSRSGLAFLEATGKFYLAGGEASGGIRDIPIEEYDPVADTWTNLTNLLTGVSNTGAVGVGQYIYVPGGYTGAAGIADMQRFDPAANTVVTMASMPLGNFAHAVVALDEKIYVLGGTETGTAGTTNYIYDIATDTWETGAALLTPVQYPAAATDGNNIYVLGGNTTNLATVQRYDPVLDSWDTIADMITGRGGPGAFFDGHNVWAVGGGWASYLTSTEYWDGSSWRSGPSLNVGVRTVDAAFGNGIALKAAGWNGAYEDTAEILEIACMLVEPDHLSSSQFPGQVMTMTLTISNTGVGDLNWEIFEEEPLAPALGPAGTFETGPYAPSAGPVPTVGGADGSPQLPVQITLGSNAYGWNSQNGPYYTVFDLDVPEVLPNIANFDPSGNFIGAGEIYNEKVYMIDVMNNMWEVDPETGEILDSYMATAPPGAETYSGMALDPTTGIVYASSTDVSTSSLFTIDPQTGAALLVGTVTNAPALIALAIDGAGDLYGYDIIFDVLLSIDKNTAEGTVIGSIGFDANFGQGMAYDPATDTIYMAAFNNNTFQAELRSVDTSTGNTALIGVLGSTTPGGLNQISWLGVDILVDCRPSDLPWLNANPTSGTIPGGASQEVSVGFDSTGLLPGAYEGTLCIESNFGRVRVPATMTVLTPSYGVELSADDPDLSGSPGETITYTLTVSNTGDVADSFTLEVSGEAWPTVLETSLITLTAGSSSPVEVYVTIPTDANDGDIDMATITATSTTDDTATDSLVLTSTLVATYGVQLTTANANLSGERDETLIYTLTISNTGNVTDTFALGISGETWMTMLETSLVELAAENSMSVEVNVTVPAGANDGDMDTATITATSTTDGTATDSLVLTSTAVVEDYLVHLPMIFKP
jgi:hypothetical protein